MIKFTFHGICSKGLLESLKEESLAADGNIRMLVCYDNEEVKFSFLGSAFCDIITSFEVLLFQKHVLWGYGYGYTRQRYEG